MLPQKNLRNMKRITVILIADVKQRWGRLLTKRFH
jgi:hypothetical protein